MKPPIAPTRDQILDLLKRWNADPCWDADHTRDLDLTPEQQAALETFSAACGRQVGHEHTLDDQRARIAALDRELVAARVLERALQDLVALHQIQLRRLERQVLSLFPEELAQAGAA